MSLIQLILFVITQSYIYHNNLSTVCIIYTCTCTCICILFLIYFMHGHCPFIYLFSVWQLHETDTPKYMYMYTSINCIV